MTGIALLDKGAMRGCAVTFVAVGADILAGFVRISVAAGAEFFRRSPQAGIVSVFKMRGVGVMTALTIQTRACTMSVGLPVLIDSRSNLAIQNTWLGRVVATRAIGDRSAAFPCRFGLSNAAGIAMAVITDLRVV